MNTIEAIMERRSIRKFTEMEISEEALQTILKAGMSGPSCVNARDWSFIVVRDKETLLQMAEANGRAATPLKEAKLGILVCGDLNRAFPKAKDYWVIDGAIAAQNMILAAKDMGIGSVWLGTWPQMDRVEKQAKLFDLPEYIVPHSLIAFGYPDEAPASRAPEWEEDRVHYEKW
jgi:nitroreductase